MQFYCVYVSDTSTGATESRLVLCERTGVTESYWSSTAPALKPGQVLSTSIGYGNYWRTVKNVQTRKFFYYQPERTFYWTGSQWMLRQGLYVPQGTSQVSPIYRHIKEPSHWVEIPNHLILLAVRQQQEGGNAAAIFDTSN